MDNMRSVILADRMLSHDSPELFDTQPTALELVGAHPSTELIRQNRAEALARREARANSLGNAVVGSVITAPLIPLIGAMWVADKALTWWEDRHA